MAEYTGACVYCGQLKIVRGGDGMDEGQINEAATMECNCEAAQMHQRAHYKKVSATANIKKLFESDGETLQEALINVVPALAWRNLAKVSIVSQDGIKATLTAKEDKIKVERTETIKSIAD